MGKASSNKKKGSKTSSKKSNKSDTSSKKKGKKKDPGKKKGRVKKETIIFYPRRSGSTSKKSGSKKTSSKRSTGKKPPKKSGGKKPPKKSGGKKSSPKKSSPKKTPPKRTQQKKAPIRGTPPRQQRRAPTRNDVQAQEMKAWQSVYDSMSDIDFAEEERPKRREPPKELDFEDMLREELGMKKKAKKKELTFEEELRAICLTKKPSRRRSYPKPKGIDNEPEYKLPTVKKFKADFKDKSRIDEILILTEEGILLRHFSYSNTKMCDEDLISGMITVIQNFVVDSFQREHTDLKEIRMDTFNIMILKGNYISAVVISPDQDLASLEGQIHKMIAEIEARNRHNFENWTGDIDVFKGMERAVKKLITGQY